jgi:hypothetical protein
MKNFAYIAILTLSSILLSLFFASDSIITDATPPAVSRAITYLASTQRGTGGWGDSTSARDTAAVVAALRLAKPSSATLWPAYAWLRGRPAATNADRARIAAALAGQSGAAPFVNALLAAQNAPADGLRGSPPIFDDDFRAPSGQWTANSSFLCASELVNGEFRVRAQNQVLGSDCWLSSELQFTDFDIEVQTRQADTTTKTYGLIFHQSRGGSPGEDTFYRFEVNPNSGQYFLGVFQNNALAPIINWTASTAIAKGVTTNLLRVVGKGTTFSLYANGRLLATRNSPAFTSGRLGLLVGNPTNAVGVNVFFDNVKIYRGRSYGTVQPNGSDGGWGIAAGYASDSLHTALALSALQATGTSSTNAVRAVSYLVAAQNSDGGWGIAKDAASTPATTAQVMFALAGYPAASGVVAALNKGGQYLAGHQNSDGGWGAGGSTVVETALAYRAVRGRTVPATTKSAAVNYLVTHQLPDGSWNEQPYDTALVLLALATKEVYLPLVQR